MYSVKGSMMARYTAQSSPEKISVVYKSLKAGYKSSIEESQVIFETYLLQSNALTRLYPFTNAAHFPD
jgi:hypothetical protein